MLRTVILFSVGYYQRLDLATLRPFNSKRPFKFARFVNCPVRKRLRSAVNTFGKLTFILSPTRLLLLLCIVSQAGSKCRAEVGGGGRITPCEETAASPFHDQMHRHPLHAIWGGKVSEGSVRTRFPGFRKEEIYNSGGHDAVRPCPPAAAWCRQVRLSPRKSH